MQTKDLNFIKTANDQQLKQLCIELRNMIINTVSLHGGHLSSNLGVIELTVALLKSFDPIKDDILFDVGHQSYAYKILCDRWDQFSSLRQENGISGFPDPRESPYDKFISGHSSTSLAVASGFAIQKKLENVPGHTIVIFGDGSITGGEAFESLNNIGHQQLPLIAILNDNEMSISQNVGAMAKSFSRFRSSQTYHKLRTSYKYHLRQWGSFGSFLEKLGEKAKSMVKQALFPEMFFEEFGFFYIGPVDGHNISEMCEMFQRAKTINKPVLIHVYTRKGKGFHYAENNPVLFHSSPSFIIENKCCKTNAGNETFSQIFGKTLLELAQENHKVVGLTAAMSEGLSMCEFSRHFPDRFFDCGIAEQHMVSSASGMAHKGLRPFVGIYATFLQRAYDQIIHDCSILQEPVVFAVDRAGAVSDDGPTHQGIFDLCSLIPIPNTILMAPSNADELSKMLKWASIQDKGPLFIRYPKECAPQDFDPHPIELAKASILKEGKDISLIFLGPFRELSFQVSEMLLKQNIHAQIINARFAKPFDQELILRCAQDSRLLATIEDGVIEGGFGHLINTFVTKYKLKTPVLNFALASQFPTTMKRQKILELSGISVDNIYQSILKKLES
jgi:1-deoxy-D-xylulose-5-phosphate synthase